MIGTTLNTTAAVIVSAIGGLGLFAGMGIADFVTVNERSMALIDLQYTDGYFIQNHEVKGGPIKGSWSAEIMRDDMQLCSGGGEAPYDGGIKKFTPDDWIGSDCPELRAGDVGSAVWEYRLKNGAIASIKGVIKLR